MKTFKQFNESITNLLKPKSEEEIMKYIEGLNQTELNEMLMDAVRSNQIDKVQIFLNAGADPNTKNEKGNTVLFFAVIGGITAKPNEKTIEMLLKNGADPNILNNREIDTLKYAERWKRSDNVINLIKKYKKNLVSFNENVRDLLQPKSKEEILSSFVNSDTKYEIINKDVFLNSYHTYNLSHPIKYSDLVDLFEKPQQNESHIGKNERPNTYFKWILKTEDNVYIQIYDYQGPTYEELKNDKPYHWKMTIGKEEGSIKYEKYYNNIMFHIYNKIL